MREHLALSDSPARASHGFVTLRGILDIEKPELLNHVTRGRIFVLAKPAQQPES